MYIDSFYFDFYPSLFTFEWRISLFCFANENEYFVACVYPSVQDNCFIHDELIIFSDLRANGFLFSNFVKSTYSETYVGFNDNYVIKIEQKKCERKLNDLKRCAEIIAYLNERGCVSCPKLLLVGNLDSGQPYLIQERINPAYSFCYADMLLSMIEQKRLGVCQGDFKQENLIFAANGICFIIDYDQAMIDKHFIEMSNLDYLNWFVAYFRCRWHFDMDYYKIFGYEKAVILGLFRDGSFNLAATTLMKKQITTDTDSGIYHNFRTPDIFIEGARTLYPRIEIMGRIKFKRLESVLDVGCNMGLLGHYLTDCGCVVTGIDMDPLIVKAAKIVANIVGKNIRFYHHDLDDKPLIEDYDTICLFSVLHHTRNVVKVAQNVAQHCCRIIVESKLTEVGRKFVNGQWVNSSSWSCADVSGLIKYLKNLFPGFKYNAYYGICDRDRHILAFTRKHV